MKNKLYYIIGCLLFISCSAQHNLNDKNIDSDSNKYFNEVIEYQNNLNKKYLDPEESPLGKENISDFKKSGGHQFFDINPTYKIIGKIDTSLLMKDVGFETSTDRIAMYDRIGVIEFILESKTYNLSIYESHYAREKPEYKNQLFLPFKDLTNGESTYGGGRYIDVERTDSNEIVIDFNKSYNPYCAYSSSYSCPVPPLENFINVEIKAGIKLKNK